MIPMIVDAAATRPITESDAPKSFVNKGRTGFLDIVELNMANMPIPHNKIKGEIAFFAMLTSINVDLCLKILA